MPMQRITWTSLVSAALAATALGGCASGRGAPLEIEAFFQAHRGGLDEVPENTLAAFRHAWRIPGAVPEVDVRTSSDGVLICLHDDTLARTTNAPAGVREMPVDELSFEEIRKWDAGVRFDRRFEGEKVPALEELLELMRGRPERELYLDVKGVDFGALRGLLERFSVMEQAIFVHGSRETCRELREFFDGARTMTWLSGSPEEIKEKFAQVATADFEGLSQLQFHLKVARIRPEIAYALDQEFLEEAVRITRAAGVELQLRPFRFDAASLRDLLDLGVRWYVADAPEQFAEALEAARER